MKVIVRDMAKLGSQYDTDVFRFRENMPAIVQLGMLVDTDIEWLGDEVEDKEVYDNEAHIFSKEYAIHYYICEVQDYYMLPKEKESMIYRIEFTTTLEIEADNEDKAIEIATSQLENEIKEDGLNQFYVYVNDESYN